MDRFNTFKLFFDTHRNKIIIVIVILFIMFISTIMFLNIDSKVKINTESKSFSNLNTISNDSLVLKKNNDNSEYYYVDIKGEVNNVGVYSLQKGKRVVDAINKAGGLTEKADTTLINQSMLLKDQMVIIVYSKEEINNLENLKEKSNIKTEICNLEVKNDACICNSVPTVVIPNIEYKSDESNISTEIDTTNTTNETSSQYEKININTASVELLMTLPKIGEVKAKAIIDYRNTFGNFSSISDIKLVKGIGDSLFESVKDYITI